MPCALRGGVHQQGVSTSGHRTNANSREYMQFFGLPSPTLIYVESFARVRSLSLSGKLLRPLVDR
jgi:Oligosaccharide biosynthesis protein Alg14 like